MANFKESMGKIWKTGRTKVWIIVSAIVLVLILTVGIITTQVGLIFGTINLVFGGYRYQQVQDSPKYYTSEFDSKAESVDYIKELSEQIVEEGIVLLKNEANALPIKTPISDSQTAERPKISVFGKHSVNMVYGGSGSGGMNKDKAVKLYDALDAQGFDYNPALKQFYEGAESGAGRPEKSPNMGDILAGLPIYESEVSRYSSVQSSYGEYNEAAIVVLSRIGGEGFDLPRTMRKAQNVNGDYEPFKDSRAWRDTAVKADGARDIDDHYLQLDTNETDLLAHVCANFDKVIVLLNSGAAMELGFLDDPGHYAYNANIKAALWIGNPGGQGNLAVAKVLSGAANPSGRLTDTYPRDFKQDPSWANFGNNLLEGGNRYYVGSWGSQVVADDAYFVRYEEGIYVGYRYWETRGFTEGETDLDNYAVRGSSTTDWNNWHEANVVYPFGHGLSYSNFNWEITNISLPEGSGISEDDIITIDVKVTNSGSVAGRDVVQLYFTAEFYDGSVEKAHVVLGDFAKTGLISPNGGHETVRLSIKAIDMASYVYDRNLENSDGHIGYKLEAGAYTLRVAKDAHQSWADIDDELAIDYVVLDDINYTKNELGNVVVNQFDDVSTHIERTAEDLEIFKHKEGKAYLTRSDWEGSWPTPPVVRGDENESYNILTGGNIGLIQAPLSSHGVTNRYDSNKAWTVEDENMPEYGKSGSVSLTELIGKDYDDPLWEELLNQLSIEEMAELIGIGAFSTVSISAIGKPPTLEYDGPGGFVIGSFMSASENSTEVCFFPCESLIGATWNKDLAYEMGRAIGEESIWGGRVNGVDYTFAGWYAPAVNIHRSQFGGRNFEYYSEDGLISGKLAANVVGGAKSKGVYTFVKHFAVNDMETNRSDNGIVTWLNEQSMREIYLKPFELTVKVNLRETKSLKTGEQIVVAEGGTTAMMSSFNRIGTTWAGCSYPLLTEVLRNEWGFNGMVITDFNNGAGTYMDLDKMIRAGGDLNLFQMSWLSTSKDKLTATHVSAMRNASHNILYTVANSNAMNLAVGARMMPMWQLIMILIFVAIILALAAWGFFVIRKTLKETKISKTSEDTKS